jgi:hypothetical protein
MGDAWLSRLVVAATVLLVIYQVGTWIHAVFGPLAGVLSAAAVAAVSIFTARMARSASSTAWFLVPTLAFTLVPLAAKLWSLHAAQATWWDRLVVLVPFLAGFALPVLLLLLVHGALHRRGLKTRDSPHFSTAKNGDSP